MSIGIGSALDAAMMMKAVLQRETNIDDPVLSITLDPDAFTMLVAHLGQFTGFAGLDIIHADNRLIYGNMTIRKGVRRGYARNS
jgi:hypothetical protein